MDVLNSLFYGFLIGTISVGFTLIRRSAFKGQPYPPLNKILIRYVIVSLIFAVIHYVVGF